MLSQLYFAYSFLFLNIFTHKLNYAFYLVTIQISYVFVAGGILGITYIKRPPNTRKHDSFVEMWIYNWRITT